MKTMMVKTVVGLAALCSGLGFAAAPASAGPDPGRLDWNITYICDRYPELCEGVQEDPKIPDVGPQCLSCPFEIGSLRLEDIFVQPVLQDSVFQTRFAG